MAELDRASIIELLNRLGAETDATALEAARELHRKVSDAGASWDELLRADLNAADAGAGHRDAVLDEAPTDDMPGEREGPSTAADKTEAARLIERLLARKGISSTLREDLDDLKRSLGDGSFDATDHRYVRALAKRLGV